MGQYKNTGNPDIVLLEELTEMISVVTKKIRFSQSWHEVIPDKGITRLDDLKSELDDVVYQINRISLDIQADQLILQVPEDYSDRAMLASMQDYADSQLD